jgi:hypothetical protein
MKFTRTNSGHIRREVIGNPNAEVHVLSKIEGGSLEAFKPTKYNIFIRRERCVVNMYRVSIKDLDKVEDAYLVF